MTLENARTAMLGRHLRFKHKQDELDSLDQSLNEKAKDLECSTDREFQRARSFNADHKITMHMKRQHMLRITTLRGEIDSLCGEISSQEDRLSECIKIRDFLEKLTPTDWLQQKAEEKRQRQHVRRQAWMETRRTSQPGAREVEASSSGEEMPMYFTHPAQLSEIFIGLEQDNLLRMECCQETEGILEEIQTALATRKEQTDKDISKMRQTIKDLENEIAGCHSQNDVLKQVVTQKCKCDKNILSATFAQFLKESHEVCGYSSVHENSEFNMISDIEARLEELLHMIDEANHNGLESFVKQTALDINRRHRHDMKRHWKEEEERKSEARRLKEEYKAQRIVSKRSSKPIMFRSPPAGNSIDGRILPQTSWQP
jgi:hypothetical protein